MFDANPTLCLDCTRTRLWASETGEGRKRNRGRGKRNRPPLTGETKGLEDFERGRGRGHIRLGGRSKGFTESHLPSEEGASTSLSSLSEETSLLLSPLLRDAVALGPERATPLSAFVVATLVLTAVLIPVAFAHSLFHILEGGKCSLSTSPAISFFSSENFHMFSRRSLWTGKSSRLGERKGGALHQPYRMTHYRRMGKERA